MARYDIPLLRIVHDLMCDPELRRRFDRSPSAVIEKYGLDATGDNQLQILLSMKNDTIADKLKVLLQELEVRPGEFPAPNGDFFQEDGGGEPMYPSPRPGVFRIRPRRVPVAKANTKFELSVFGQSFVVGRYELLLKRVLPTAPPDVFATLSPPDLLGTFRASVIRTIVSPPSTSIPFSANDKFQVIVNINPGTPEKEDVGPGAANLLLEIV